MPLNHLEFAQAESAALNPDQWEIWAKKVERAAGIADLNGDQDADGYSLDFAYKAFKAGVSCRDHASKVRAAVALRRSQKAA